MLEDPFIELIDPLLRAQGSILEDGEEFREPNLTVLRYYRRRVRLGPIPMFGKALSVVTVVRQPIDLDGSQAGQTKLLTRLALAVNGRFPPWKGLVIGLTSLVITPEPIGPGDDAILQEAPCRETSAECASFRLRSFESISVRRRCHSHSGRARMGCSRSRLCWRMRFANISAGSFRSWRRDCREIPRFIHVSPTEPRRSRFRQAQSGSEWVGLASCGGPGRNSRAGASGSSKFIQERIGIKFPASPGMAAERPGGIPTRERGNEWLRSRRGQYQYREFICVPLLSGLRLLDVFQFLA